ncbi:MAG: hypothetical protein ABJA82_05340 [Myxococcales bacterium]
MAMLQKQTAIVTLKGLNQKSPGTIGAPGELELAENLIAKRGGQGTFEFVRRNGMTTIASIPFGGTGFRLASYNNALVILGPNVSFSSGVSLYQYDSASGTIIVPNGSLDETTSGVVIGRDSLSVPAALASGASTPTQTSLDIAYIGNISLYVWVDQANGLNYALRDTASQAVLAFGLIVSSGVTNAKCVSLGTSFYVFWKEANAIKATSISSTTFAVAAASTVVAAGSALAGTDYDIQAGFNGTNIALMYRASAANHVRALLTTAFAVGTSVTDAVAANQPNVAQCWITQQAYAGNLYYATVNTANGSKLQTISATTLTISATISSPTTTAAVNVTGFVPTGGTPRLIIEVTDALPYRHNLVMITTGDVGNRQYNCSLASRAFYLAGFPYLIGLYNSASNALTRNDTYLLIPLSGGATPAMGFAAGKALPAEAGRAETLHVCSVVPDTAGMMHFLGKNVIAAESATAASLVIQYGLSDLSFESGSSKVGGSVAFGGVLYSPGGQLSEFDGSGDKLTCSREQGFYTYPEPPSLAEGAAASGSIQPGTYSVVTFYKWIDKLGQVARSAPSTPVAITTVNANSSIVETSEVYKFLTKLVHHMEFFRTPKNGDGSIYFKATPAVYTAFSTGTTQSFVDTASDPTLQASEVYTPSNAGGDLENIQAKASAVICEHKNRLFGVVSEQPHRVQFSKEYVPGTSIGFFDGFIINTPEATGPIYALASMDGHLIAIKRDCIYVISGDFPDATGGGPQIPLPTVIPAGVGTTAPRSVVVTSHGVMFHSITKGFWLLNRSLQVSYIGAQVETQANTGSVVISGASVMSDKTQVRWTSEGGTSFVLDTYFLEQGTPIWTTFTGQPCVHSINHLGRWYHLTSDGKLKVENAIWCDGSQPGETGGFTPGAEYFGKLTVSDINFGGILGFVRCWRGQLLGEWFAAHKLKVTLQRNHRNVNENPFTFDATANPDPYMMEFRPQIQKATSLTVTIEETTTGSQQTQGAAWTALAFSVGTKPGVSRLPQTKTMVGS